MIRYPLHKHKYFRKVSFVSILSHSTLPPHSLPPPLPLPPLKCVFTVLHTPHTHTNTTHTHTHTTHSHTQSHTHHTHTTLTHTHQTLSHTHTHTHHTHTPHHTPHTNKHTHTEILLQFPSVFLNGERHTVWDEEDVQCFNTLDATRHLSGMHTYSPLTPLKWRLEKSHKNPI